MSKQALFALFLLVCAGPLCAQNANQDPDFGDPCTQYLQTPLPAEALAVAAPKTWPDCESYKSYSGLGRKVDYAAARLCA
ncbi:MAG: hypothetical protein WB341_05975 [Terracidiphilus sp.]